MAVFAGTRSEESLMSDRTNGRRLASAVRALIPPFSTERPESGGGLGYSARTVRKHALRRDVTATETIGERDVATCRVGSDPGDTICVEVGTYAVSVSDGVY